MAIGLPSGDFFRKPGAALPPSEPTTAKIGIARTIQIEPSSKARAAPLTNRLTDAHGAMIQYRMVVGAVFCAVYTVLAPTAKGTTTMNDKAIVSGSLSPRACAAALTRRNAKPYIARLLKPGGLQRKHR